MKLLLASIQPRVQSSWVEFFKREGWRCELAKTTYGFWRQTNAYDYESILVYRQFTHETTKLADVLRREGCRSVLVLLTDLDEAGHRIAHLQAGYDDVLPQSIDRQELKVRLQAILRRQNRYTPQELKAGALQLNPEARTASINGQQLTLTQKEFDILYFLARHHRRVATKTQMVEYLWGEGMEDAASYDFLYAHVKNLRKKLSKAGADDLIESVYGLGYKLT